MERRHKPEQTAVGGVPEQMAPHFDGVARPDVFALDAVPSEPERTGGF
jgi:hypothetical protein